MGGPGTDIDDRKLDLDRERLRLEEQWRRRTYVWSIGSALLSAGVAVTVALIAAGGGKAPASSGIAVAPIQACRDSVRRLDTLSGAVAGQTVATLADAIRRHTDQCDDVLVQLLTELRK